MRKCNTFVGETTHACSLEPGHKSDCVAFVNGVEVARAPWPKGLLKGVKTWTPVPERERHDVHLPSGCPQRTQHQRRFGAFLRGALVEGGTIVSHSAEWARQVAVELGADELRLLREYHNA
jgi:hypothetical protein